jgi:recombinational DNA repair ATPase RecF
VANNIMKRRYPDLIQPCEVALGPNIFQLSRYRAFRDVTLLELAPLTVIIGKNGGGKSVLTRLPLLL